jgi:hypothetical protein
MKVVVVGMAPKSSECWSKLFETLDGGVAEGVIAYDVIDFFDAVDDTIKQYDGAIYLENAPITEDIPFMALDNCDFTDEEFFEFIDTVQEYIEWKKGEEAVEPVPEVVEKPKKGTKSSGKDTPINLDDLAYEITEADIKKLVFKAVTVTIGGKEVKLDIREFIALSKMCKVMDRFGYKVKNVII